MSLKLFLGKKFLSLKKTNFYLKLKKRGNLLTIQYLIMYYNKQFIIIYMK